MTRQPPGDQIARLSRQKPCGLAPGSAVRFQRTVEPRRNESLGGFWFRLVRVRRILAQMSKRTRRTTKRRDSTSSAAKESEIPVFPFQLVDIRLYQVTVERHSPEQEGKDPPSLSVLLLKGEEPPSSLEFDLRLHLETRLPHGDAPECSIALSIEGHFKAVVDPASIRPETTERFKTADAILLMWPYLRETLHNLTERLRIGVPPLPVIDARALVTPTGERVNDSES